MLFPESFDPPIPPSVPFVQRIPFMGRGVCWSDLVVAPMVAEFGPITPYPDAEKARLLAEHRARRNAEAA